MTPGTYPMRSVASLATYLNGYPFKPEDHHYEGTPVVRIRQLVDETAEMDYYQGSVPSKNKIDTGDLIFSWSGSLAVRTWDRGPAFLNQHLFKVVPGDGVDQRWLRWALEYATWLFDPYMHGSAMTHITKPMMRAVRVPNPPLNVQRRIADFLDDQTSRIDNIITARHQQVELLHEQVRALLSDQLLVREGPNVRVRRLIQDERLGAWGEESDGVNDVRVARVADFDRSSYLVTQVPTLRSLPKPKQSPRLLRPGDVLLERSGGGDKSPVGFACLYAPDADEPTITSNFLSRLRPRDEVPGRYLSLALAAMYESRWNVPYFTQTTGIQNLDSEGYLNQSLPSRSSSEMATLATVGDRIVNEVQSALSGHRRSAALLQELKRSLISAAVSGEFDVSAADGSRVVV